MPESSRTAQRFDPYKNFRFRVKMDGRYVAGVSKVSGITHPLPHDVASASASRGRTKFEAITLERGVTHDSQFEQWANNASSSPSAPGADLSAKGVRKDLIIEVFDEAGRRTGAFKISRAWVSEFQAAPDLDANANAIAIQHMRLENEGWSRDADVKEPREPS